MLRITRKRLAGISLFLVILPALVLASAVSAGGPKVHSVSAGGSDACVGFGLEPGCDANFSLVAKEQADGSVSGQYTDQFGQGNGGFRAEINCLFVDGNDAWVSGVITHETISGDGSLVGTPVSTRVKDNGTSANDPSDQISFSHFGGSSFECTDAPDVALFDAPQGQVKVK